MEAECYPLSLVPGTSALFRDYAERDSPDVGPVLRASYPIDPFSMAWAKDAPDLPVEHREKLADLLRVEVEAFGGNGRTLGNVEKLRRGAAAVVTGQQVGLFGGPLLTLLKAATAIRKAQDATKLSGREHVAVFWLASEDHDLAEVDQVSLLGKGSVEKLQLGLRTERPLPVGSIPLVADDQQDRAKLEAVLDYASELLGWAPICDLLRESYASGKTLAQAFGTLLTKVFADQGLIVMDASSRQFHKLGAPVLRLAIERADELESALMARSEELVTAGYHAQVLVTPGQSLLFLLDEQSGARLPLRRTADGSWKAGLRSYTTEDLLKVLEGAPERLSPNALLRPVFQDSILPTAAYIGGPAEIAYFAQSAVIYEQILGRVTAVLPRLSATLVDPAIAAALATHELKVAQVWEAKTVEELALRLGARAMPIENKRKLAAVGNAMDAELTALTEYMSVMSADLGRAAGVSGSKMRYQMNRLRRLSAAFELQKEASLRKHASAIMLNIFPDGHLQERLLGGVQFLAKFGDGLPELLIQHAGQECPGHRVIYL